MNFSKIKDALADLERQRDLIDGAIKGLRNVLANASDSNGQTKMFDGASPASGSYVDLAVNLITNGGGRPVHISTILEHIRTVKRNPLIKRQSVEATFFRHMTDNKEKARLVKSAPGMYGLKHYTRADTNAYAATNANTAVPKS